MPNKNSKREKLRREIKILTTEELLLSFLDAGVKFYDVFGGSYFYPRSIKSYYRWSELEKIRLRNQIQRFKKQKLVETFIKNEETWIKLTPRGEKKVIKALFEKNKIPVPKKWDRKWRIIVFDIPEKLKVARNILRDKLENLGFYRMQKSVFVYPFDCQKEIKVLRNIYEIEPYLLYFEAKKIENKRKLLEIFIERGILTEDLI